MLVALYYHLIWDKFDNQPWRPTPTQLGYRYYAWLLVIQALVLVLGGFSRISRTLVEERKAGLLDSNRMTPLTGSQLVMGYWFGSALREFYLAAVLIPVGFGIVLKWLDYRYSSGWARSYCFFPFGTIFWAIGDTRGDGHAPSPRWRRNGAAAGVGFSCDGRDLAVLAHEFLAAHLRSDASVPSVRTRLSAMGVGGWLLWSDGFAADFHFNFAEVSLAVWRERGAVRKFGNPQQPAFSRSEIMTVYGLLVFFQYGLVWEQRELYSDPSHLAALCALHGSILFLGVVMLTPQLLYPEKARIVAMRHGAKGISGFCGRAGRALRSD